MLADPNKYLNYLQHRSLFAIGDRVQIVAELDERDGWVDSLDEYCGQLGTITDFAEKPEHADEPWYSVRMDGDTYSWWWSHDWLIYQGESDESICS